MSLRRTVVTVLLVLSAIPLDVGVARSAKPRCMGKPATIVGQGGHADIKGTSGPDVIVGTNEGEAIRGGGGADLICARNGDDYVYGGEGADRINAGLDFGFSDTVYGGPGNDYLRAGPAIDPASGSDRADLVAFTDAKRSVVVDLVAGTATGQGRDTLVNFEQAEGSAFDDTLTGPDVMFGLLIGLNGDDTLSLGEGNWSAVLPGEGDDVVTAPEGEPRIAVVYDDVAGPVTVDLSEGTASGAGNDTFTNMNDILGTAGADTLIGHDGSNHIFGAGGADEIRGAGNDATLDDPYSFPELPNGDFLDGDGGWSGPAAPAADTLAGGEGVAFACYCAAVSGVTIDLAEGTATGGGGNDTLTDVNGLIGSNFDDTLLGSEADEAFEGSVGDDTVDGRGGTDSFIAFHSEGMTADLGAGTAAASFPGVVDDVFGFYPSTASLTGIEDLWGSLHADDELTGDAADNRLYGMGGDDVLNGLGGSDLLDGSEGNDTGDGGPGNDECVDVESASACEGSQPAQPIAPAPGSYLPAPRGMTFRVSF